MVNDITQGMMEEKTGNSSYLRLLRHSPLYMVKFKYQKQKAKDICTICRPRVSGYNITKSLLFLKRGVILPIPWHPLFGMYIHGSFRSDESQEGGLWNISYKVSPAYDM